MVHVVVRIISPLGAGEMIGHSPQMRTGRPVMIEQAVFRRLRLGGVQVGAYTPAESQSAWAKALSLLEKTGMKPLVDSVWELEKLPDAFARLAAGPLGKVVLKV